MKSTHTFHSPPELILTLRCEYRALNEVLIDRCKPKPKLFKPAPCFAAKVGRGSVEPLGGQERNQELEKLLLFHKIQFPAKHRLAVACTYLLENQATILWTITQ